MLHLIGTNTSPSESELLATRQILAEKEEELKRLEIEIATPEHHNPPIRERDEILEFVKVHLPILSPAKRMPRDVWVSIFIRCLPDTQFVGPSTKDGPLLIGSVCQAWRTISHSMPTLWASISADFEDLLPPPVMSLIERWLSRSGTCPLSLRIQDWRYSRAENELSEDITTLLSIFITRFDRWANIDLQLPRPRRISLHLPTHPTSTS